MTQPVMTTQPAGSKVLTDRSQATVAITTAQLMPANTNRDGYTIQNVGTTVVWINDTGGAATAGAGSFSLAAGATFTPAPGGVSNTAINIISVTSTGVVTAREW